MKKCRYWNVVDLIGMLVRIYLDKRNEWQKHWLKQQLKTIYSLAETFIIKQLTKRDHHKEQDVQTFCTRSSVSSLKNDKILIQEVTVSILIITFWLIACWFYGGWKVLDWSESAVGVFLENSWINQTTLYYCCFYRLLAATIRNRLGNIEYNKSLAKSKNHLGQTTNEMLIENTNPKGATKLVSTLLSIVIELP